MSYWSHNPELYTEIIFKEMIAKGLATEDDYENIDEVVNNFLEKPDSWKLASEAERDYWADRLDEAVARQESLDDR